MTAQEKANELWTTYRFALSIKNAPLGEQKDLIAKQCVLIALNEVIRLDIFDCNCEWSDEDGDTREYWQKVKKELEKL